MKQSEKAKISLDTLNEYQRQAVLDQSRACVVNACVGSGKTTVLTQKVKYLLEEQQVPLEEMMVLTFTNRAADEIAERLGLNVGTSEDSTYYFGTFHSVAMKLLKERLPVEELGWTREFEVILPEDELELAKTLVKDYKLKIKYMNRLAKRLEQEYGAYILDGINGTPKYEDDLFVLMKFLEVEKRRLDRMSYDDLMRSAVTLLKKESYHPQWILVDEVQDCNMEQVEFLKLLYGPDTHLFAVGDPNQMIYGFRGGGETCFYQVKNYFDAKEISLPINYRSTPEILALANRFRQFGERIVGVEREELEHGDLGRDDLEQETANQGVSNRGASNVSNKIAVRQYYDPFQEAELLGERVLELVRDGVAFSDIAIFYRMQEQESFFSKAFERLNIPYGEESHGVQLMTLHAAKGLEFDYVFIVGLNQGLIPMVARGKGDLMEEQRLFFVGITRAQRFLELSYYTNPSIPQVQNRPSDFLMMLPKELLDWEKNPSVEERKANLQRLKQEVLQERQKKAENVAEVENTADKAYIEKTPENYPRLVRHAKYGEGTVVSEDDLTIEVNFEGYGVKSFLKMLGEIEE